MKVSFRMDSTASQMHNSRDGAYNKDEHIDLERSKDNITLINLDARKVYDTVFTPVIEEYNSRQKRKDRRLEYNGAGYYDKVLNTTFNKSTKQGNKTCEQHPYYELIVQIGDETNHPDPAMCADIMREYLEGLKERTRGHLLIIGAYIHMDEATPHMHIDYIPVATYDRGMKLQTGLNRSFEQLMNYKSQNAHDTAQMQFQAQEREIFRGLCLNMGLDIDEIQHNDAVHKSVEDYKRDRLKSDLEQVQAIEDASIEDKSRSGFINKKKVVVPKEDYDLLLSKAKQEDGLRSVVTERDKQIEQLQGRLDRFEQGITSEQQSLRDKKKHLQEREQAVSRKEKQVEQIMSGDAFKKEYRRYKETYNAREDLIDDVRALEDAKASLERDTDILQAKYNSLSSKLDEVKEWLQENSLKKYMREFCNKFKDEFAEFAKKCRQRDDLDR